MTDAEWRALCALINLPSAARKKIENLIEIYQRFAAPRRPPHETKRELARIETWAGKMLSALDIDEVAEAMLVTWERDGPPPAGGGTLLDDAAVRLEEYHASLARLQAWAARARQALAPATSGSNPVEVRWLMKLTSAVVTEYAGRPLNRSQKGPRDFACAIGQMVDPPIGPGAVDEALKSLRGGISAD